MDHNVTKLPAHITQIVVASEASVAALSPGFTLDVTHSDDMILPFTMIGKRYDDGPSYFVTVDHGLDGVKFPGDKRPVWKRIMVAFYECNLGKDPKNILPTLYAWPDYSWDIEYKKGEKPEKNTFSVQDVADIIALFVVKGEKHIHLDRYSDANQKKLKEMS